MQRFAKIAAFVVVCAAAVWPAGSVQTLSSCLVVTGAGAVQGLDRGTACAFLGIPFAAPPIGGLRWKPPQAAGPWAPAVLTATAAPPSCAQLSAATGLPSGSEDCLKLNIWMPNPAPLLSAPQQLWSASVRKLRARP
jgi:para-nitrobenzyl esterase